MKERVCSLHKTESNLGVVHDVPSTFYFTKLFLVRHGR